MANTQTLLLELHCEEIPARFLKPLSQEFAHIFLDFAKGQRLGSPSAQVFFSPRKLAWRIQGLLTAQPEIHGTQVGPPMRMCLDESGRPTIQGQKFAEKWGVEFAEIKFEKPAGKKEPCAVVDVLQPGRTAIEILAEALPGMVSSLHVPKAMRWGISSYVFVRPIRSILCIFGSEIVPFTIDGAFSGNTTWGHRLYHRENAAPLLVEVPEKYEAVLKEGGVIASFDERRQMILSQLGARAEDVGGGLVADEGLLDTLALIAEWPSVLRGAFPADFLDLPKEVLVTCLKEHQKAFCVEKHDGSGLLPCFLTIANRKDDPNGLVIAGNEWVLKARLYDARFFFAEDRRVPLSDLAPKLSALTFHRELGSYAEKTKRISDNAVALAKQLGLDAEHAKAAAEVCKADLVTLMVGEFPELQGVMGGYYLDLEGAPKPVSVAVGEHYMPLSAEAPLPASGLGMALAIADKVDTLAGCFVIGMIPTGSKDPLALRRAGAGIVRMVWEKGLDLSIDTLINIGLDAIASRTGKTNATIEEARSTLTAFFRDRVAYQLEVAGVRGPVGNSALAAGWTDINDLKIRCEALSAFAEDQRFASLGMSAKRIANILKDEVPSEEFDPSLLDQAEEKYLNSRLGTIESASGYDLLIAALADLAQPLEDFFNAVMVKCEDEALRSARLSLLHRLRKAFLKVADFGQWQ